MVYFLAGVVYSTPFPVKSERRGQVGTSIFQQVRKHQVSRAARKPGPARSSPPCSRCCHLDSFPPSLKSFKNTSGREEGRAHRVTGREKGSAWPSSEADPESPGRRPTRCTAPAPTWVPSLQGRGGRTHNPARGRGRARRGRATSAKKRRSGRRRSPPEEPPVSLRAAAFHIPPPPFHEQGGRGSSTKL